MSSLGPGATTNRAAGVESHSAEYSVELT